MTSQLKQVLPVLFSLAQQHTEVARVELAGMLADLFLGDDAALSLRESERVNELIDQLMLTHTPAVRAQLVHKFATSKAAQMPRRMALSLVQDSIEVAGNVLKSNLLLTDEDLISVVKTQSHNHAEAVAQRAAINEAVADALIVTGDLRVMQLVAENMGADLSLKAVDVLADAARFTESLREPLMKRPEMTPDAATKLYWWVSQDLRRFALKRFGISGGQIDEALSKTVHDLLAYHTFEKSSDVVANQMADWMEERQIISIKLLPQVLRLGHFRLFDVLLGRMADMPLDCVDQLVAEAGGKGLAAVCCAIGIDKPSFVSIFLLSRGGRSDDKIVNPRELNQALDTFDQLTVSRAQVLLRSWRQSPSYFGRRVG